MVDHALAEIEAYFFNTILEIDCRAGYLLWRRFFSFRFCGFGHYWKIVLRSFELWLFNFWSFHGKIVFPFGRKVDFRALFFRGNNRRFDILLSLGARGGSAQT